jgi:signal transduction histidine kinase
MQSSIDAIGHIDAVPTILDVVCRTTGMGFAAVACVTESQWIACSVRDTIGLGLKAGSELPIRTTICNEIRQNHNPVIIDHVAEDELFRTHPTPAMYGFQSYISVPIILSGGVFFGTLCALDPAPARVNTPEVVGMFKLFAELIASHLDSAARLASSELSLKEERKNAELREQFIAVLGHDLRNPLGAIGSGASLLQRMKLDERGHSVALMMQNSVARMSGLIDNVLDFARGRLGGGLALNQKDAVFLNDILHQVVAEMRSTWPDRALDTHIDLQEPVACDPSRIAQLASNLLSNALTYGTPAAPVRFHAVSHNGSFELWIANSGEAIAPAALERLFHPFARGAVRADQQGLGLGLYIASEIARAHHGTLRVTSDEHETRFTFRMPTTPS